MSSSWSIVQYHTTRILRKHNGIFWRGCVCDWLARNIKMYGYHMKIDDVTLDPKQIIENSLGLKRIV